MNTCSNSLRFFLLHPSILVLAAVFVLLVPRFAKRVTAEVVLRRYGEERYCLPAHILYLVREMYVHVPVSQVP